LMGAVFDADTLDFTVGNNLGIHDKNREQSIVLYPNPFTNYLTVNTDAAFSSGEYLLEIYSLPGRKVVRKTVKNTERISLASLADGTYIAELTDKDGKKIRKKIVKYSRDF